MTTVHPLQGETCPEDKKVVMLDCMDCPMLFRCKKGQKVYNS